MHVRGVYPEKFEAPVSFQITLIIYNPNTAGICMRDFMKPPSILVASTRAIMISILFQKTSLSCHESQKLLR
jgi:hypothetical protein